MDRGNAVMIGGAWPGTNYSVGEHVDVQPLTKEELAWVRRLESLLLRMPKRLLMVEIADSIEIVDRAAARGVELADGNAERSGIVLHHVRHSSGKLTGVSG